MRVVYRNPKELATKLKDLVDTYREGLIDEEKFQNIIVAMVEKNEDRVYKNGFMPTKLINTLGEERKLIIDEIINKKNS